MNGMNFSEALRKLGVYPIFRGRFSPEQLSKYSVIARRLSEDTSSRPFRIVFCGVFSSGKTSLINSLLAYDKLNLPVGINPVTKMITRLRYASRLSCYYKKDGLTLFISPQEMEQIVQGRMKISADNNEIIITLPSEILRSNIEIIDTPGFDDEAGELERISRSAIAEADMAVLCCNALMLGKITERDLLAELEDIAGHFSLVLTRIDNLNDMNDYEEVMTQARRLMKNRGDSAGIFGTGHEFVFPVIASGKHKHIDEFRDYLAGIISRPEIMNKIQGASLRKGTATCVREIASVTEETITRLKASLLELETLSQQAVTQQELDASFKISSFENIKEAAINAAAAFTAQRMAELRKDIKDLWVYKFQREARKLADQAMKKLIDDLADYARSKNLKGHEQLRQTLQRKFDSFSYGIPAPVQRRVKSRGIIGQTLFTALDFIASIPDGLSTFTADDGYDYYYEEYHEPAVNAVWKGPVTWLAGQWKEYLDGIGSGIKTSGFSGGHEQEIKQLKDNIARCEKVNSLIASVRVDEIGRYTGTSRRHLLVTGVFATFIDVTVNAMCLRPADTTPSLDTRRLELQTPDPELVLIRNYIGSDTLGEDIKRADSIAVMMNGSSLMSKGEYEFMKANFLGKGMRNLFFLVSVGSVPARELEAVKRQTKDCLWDFFTSSGSFDSELYSRRVFFVYPYSAYMHRVIDANNRTYTDEELREFEGELYSFLGLR